MENKICIYAICKDEIKFVDKWLDSMAEADYIVVLDTGSTDGTYEKLQQDPRVTRVEQKVISPWRFDVARNESLKLVPEDANILFCTDLDELLDPGWGKLIRDNWKEDTWRGHYRYVWSHTAAGNPGTTFWYDKLHKPGYQWHYPIHEVLLPPGGEMVLFTEEPSHLIDFGNNITLHHYPDQTKSRSNYLSLLNLRVEENPQEAYGWFLLGREYAAMSKIPEAISTLSHTLELSDTKNKPLIEHCSIGYLGDLYSINREFDKAAECYNKQLFKDKTYREPYLSLAEIYNYHGYYELAELLVRMALKNAFQHFDWTERDSAWNAQPYDILSVSYYNLGKIDECIENSLKALQLDPLNDRIQKNYLAFLEKKRQ